MQKRQLIETSAAADDDDDDGKHKPPKKWVNRSTDRRMNFYCNKMRRTHNRFDCVLLHKRQTVLTIRYAHRACIPLNFSTCSSLIFIFEFSFAVPLFIFSVFLMGFWWMRTSAGLTRILIKINKIKIAVVQRNGTRFCAHRANCNTWSDKSNRPTPTMWYQVARHPSFCCSRRTLINRMGRMRSSKLNFVSTQLIWLVPSNSRLIRLNLFTNDQSAMHCIVQVLDTKSNNCKYTTKIVNGRAIVDSRVSVWRRWFPVHAPFFSFSVR